MTPAELIALIERKIKRAKRIQRKAEKIIQKMKEKNDTRRAT